MVWYKTQQIGINRLGAFAKTMAEMAGLTYQHPNQGSIDNVVNLWEESDFNNSDDNTRMSIESSGHTTVDDIEPYIKKEPDESSSKPVHVITPAVPSEKTRCGSPGESSPSGLSASQPKNIVINLGCCHSGTSNQQLISVLSGATIYGDVHIHVTACDSHTVNTKVL